ncbi:MAG: hypothetical protein JO314_13255, partial [Acidobacteria bacterium]|nr:hypothetical protein [Acidobacteriota bacterium]
MSAILGLIATAIVTGIALPKGIGMVSRSLQKLSKDIGLDASRPLNNRTPVVAAPEMGTIRSVRQIRSEMPAITMDGASAGDVDDAKRMLVGHLMATPFLASDTSVLDQNIAALRSACTMSEVEKAGADLTRAIEDAHQVVFASAVTSACENASRKTGFTKIETL